jgi:hypothetical protein
MVGPDCSTEVSQIQLNTSVQNYRGLNTPQKPRGGQKLRKLFSRNTFPPCRPGRCEAKPAHLECGTHSGRDKKATADDLDVKFVS